MSQLTNFESAFPNKLDRSVKLGDSVMNFEIKKIAKQAHGSVIVRFGDSVVLTTVCAGKEPRPGVNFLPLTCDYIEKTFAAGKIPGGFYKREGRPRDHETLMSRIIDRSIRPLFPDAWRIDTQVIATVLSYDPDFPTDVCAMIGTSLALSISNIPFQGPIAATRVGYVGGKLLLNPTQAQRAESALDLFVSCSESAITMVEGGGDEVSEALVVDALLFAHESAKPVIKMQRELQAEIGETKRIVPELPKNESVERRVHELAAPTLRDVMTVKDKHQRYAAVDALEKSVLTKLQEELNEEEFTQNKGLAAEAFENEKSLLVRKMMVHEKIRIDGRGIKDIRPIYCEVGFLPRVHGSALFQRGETQAIVVTTLGTSQDEQRLDTLEGNAFKRFLLHYNFPPYSVGEVKPLRSPGRREIGHGALAERALERLVPETEKFPYMLRTVSEVTESNGSSSMATVCGGTLSMMDAGVPVRAMAAGIAMGLVEQDGKIAVISDILGDEDHLGDMDFKVCGTKKGITAVQMDIKLTGVSRETLEVALEQAREGRLFILGEMSKALDAPRTEVSRWAPRITKIQIRAERIKDVIGPGGKVIKDIITKTNVQIDIQDDGTVLVASPESQNVDRAIRMIKDLTREPEIGKVYLGTVRKVMDFGAFVEIFPGTDGLVHISDLSDKRVNKVEDIVCEGDEVLVKVIGVDRQGKIKLSRKEALGQQVSE